MIDIKRAFDKYHHTLLYHVFRKTKCIEEAKDIVSDAFVTLLTSDTRFISEKHLLSFLFKVAQNKLIDKARARKRATVREEEYAHLYMDVSQQLIDNETSKAEAIKCMYASLQRLPRKNQEIISLYLQGASYKEIALQLNTSPSNVLHHIRNAARHLRKQLRPLLLLPT